MCCKFCEFIQANKDVLFCSFYLNKYYCGYYNASQVNVRIAAVFDTATNTVTDMVIVEHVTDIPNLSGFLPVGPILCIQSIIFTVKDGLSVTVTR